MFDNQRNPKHNPYCDLVPGFAAYNRVGDNLAEGLVNLVEKIAELASIAINHKTR